MKKQVLSHSIKIYCPVKDNDGNDLINLVQSVIDSMTIIYGGCTVYEANGCWRDNNITYNDENVICQSFTSARIFEDTYLHIVERIINDGKQYAVSVELDNQLIIYSK